MCVQMSHAEKQRFQSCRSELVTKLCSGVHQLVTMPTEDELAATEVHTSANERFVEVAEKLIDRISNEKKSYQAKVQQAVVCAENVNWCIQLIMIHNY